MSALPRSVAAMGEITGPDRLLLDRIIAALKAESQYVQHFDEDDVEGVQKVRSLGRRAGRELGWKIMTHASDPDKRQDRHVVVIVVAAESTPLHEELMRIRGEKKLRQFWDRLDPC